MVFARTRPAADRHRHRGVPGSGRLRRRPGRGQGRQDGAGGARTADVRSRRAPAPRPLGGRRRRRRLPRRDDDPWPAAACTSRPSRSAPRNGPSTSPWPTHDRHAGRHPDRRLPTGPGDARRPADRRAGRPRDGPRRRPAYVTGEDRRIAPSVAKLFCTEMVGRVADLAVQIHGGTGYMREIPVERIYRDVRLLRLYEGTSEIQRLIIGGALVRQARKTALGAPPRRRHRGRHRTGRRRTVRHPPSRRSRRARHQGRAGRRVTSPAATTTSSTDRLALRLAQPRQGIARHRPQVPHGAGGSSDDSSTAPTCSCTTCARPSNGWGSGRRTPGGPTPSWSW